MSTCRLNSVRTIKWDYVYLVEVRAEGDGATLTCGYEADSPELEVACHSLDALEPYLEIHHARRATPAVVEPPLIPVIQTGLGQLIFSTDGASYDYPYAVQT